MHKLKNYLFAAIFAFISVSAYANQCKMTITAKNDTASSVMAAVFNERDEKLSVLAISGSGSSVFTDLCPSLYKVIFKDGAKYTESEIVNITYTVTVVDNKTTKSWSNGNVRYFATRTGGSGKPAEEKYRF